MRGASISIDRLSKSYGTVEALKGVSVEVAAGEFFSLLGPSGCGKTTLLMTLAGFETPSSGTVFVDGEDITHTPPNKRNVGMVFQRYSLFPHMTVAKNVGFPLRMRGAANSAINERVEEALGLVHLETFMDRLPSQLSGGQQQRVAVARAIAFDPPILLMDEPLSALDKKLREQMQIEIKAIQETLGITVVYVTHDQEEALKMSDRIAVMHNGELAQIGSPEDLYMRPKNRFVADFIGKMNFISASFHSADGSAAVLRIGDASHLTIENGALAHLSLPQPGQAVIVAVRPENISLHHHTDAEPGATIHGRIRESIFVGSFQVYLVDVDDYGAEPLFVQSTPGQYTFGRDDPVRVSFDSDAAHIFSAATAS